ncbi:hypothetical protein, partial [Riemerella anatipestifer]|uniref:hypothetical protein n=1 Tax=Riemerella anatipestifer TaxID=34085 RepID=UPI002860CFB5
GFCKKAGAVLLGHNVIFITFVLLGEGKCFFCPLLRKAPPLAGIVERHPSLTDKPKSTILKF